MNEEVFVLAGGRLVWADAVLVRQEAVPNRTRILWMLVVLLIPLLGPIAYYVFGHSPIQRSLRIVLVAGGLATYAVVTALAIALGP